MLDLQPPADQVAALLSGIDDSQLTGPTPCHGQDVATLLAHLLGLSVAFRDAARKIDGPTTSTPPNADEAELPDTWRTLLPHRLDELVSAWRHEDAWRGDTQAGGVPLPAPIAAGVANNELVLHGWDLAVATGQPFSVEADNLQASWQFVRDTPDEPSARNGLFGPVVPVSSEASLLDRTLGGAGRDPAWSPARMSS